MGLLWFADLLLTFEVLCTCSLKKIVQPGPTEGYKYVDRGITSTHFFHIEVNNVEGAGGGVMLTHKT